MACRGLAAPGAVDALSQNIHIPRLARADLKRAAAQPIDYPAQMVSCAATANG